MNSFLKLNDQRLVRINISEDKVLSLKFVDYDLTVYNPFSLGNCSGVYELINKKVIKIDIIDCKSFELNFEGKLKLIVHIDDDSYKTPEAMQLDGPNNLIAVWQ